MKFRNISGEDRIVPSLYRTVKKDEVFEVPDRDAPGLKCQPHLWADESTPSTKNPK